MNNYTLKIGQPRRNEKIPRNIKSSLTESSMTEETEEIANERINNQKLPNKEKLPLELSCDPGIMKMMLKIVTLKPPGVC